MEDRYFRLVIRLFDLNEKCTYRGNGNIILIPKEGIAEGYIANDYVFIEFGENITSFVLINWNDNYWTSLECNRGSLVIPGHNELTVEGVDYVGKISILTGVEIHNMIQIEQIKERVQEVKNMCK